MFYVNGVVPWRTFAPAAFSLPFTCCGPSGLPLWRSPGPSSYLMPQDLGMCWQSYLQSPHHPLLRSSASFSPACNFSTCPWADRNLLRHSTRQAPPRDSSVKKTLSSSRGGDAPLHLCDSSWLTRVIKWSPGAFRFPECWWSWPCEVSTCHSWKRNEKDRTLVFWAQERQMKWPL